MGKVKTAAFLFKYRKLLRIAAIVAVLVLAYLAWQALA